MTEPRVMSTDEVFRYASTQAMQLLPPGFILGVAVPPPYAAPDDLIVNVHVHLADKVYASSTVLTPPHTPESIDRAVERLIADVHVRIGKDA